ncbi:tocopherol O-methyltransferase, chloroplastic isoform X2 [Cucumis sativus]|uniref:tocopherol O-methyltransferase, chloroplastic isoform X2 n=1 Tax=Cucumis sativus TaxID=3659 RepID=UPI0012F4A008|nr:tocopherol O-methyltransferase, chloroplastic isoform X2 [Cucumis sativus]
MNLTAATPIHTSSYPPSSLHSNPFNSISPRPSFSSFTPRRFSPLLASSSAATTPPSLHMDSHRLHKGIAEFYDQSSGLWENVWGQHMHHGFYDPHSSVSLSDHRAAQIRMIEETLRFAGVEAATAVVDVGCGIGGSSRYLATKFGAKCRGITLSPVQAKRAQEISAAEGLSDKVCFEVADALNQPFSDGEFDLVWSMESGEHMPDKSKFVSELVRVTAPGGTIIIVTWCHRDLGPSESSLQPWELKLLQKICDGFYLPAWCSTADYVKLLQSHNLQLFALHSLGKASHHSYELDGKQ